MDFQPMPKDRSSEQGDVDGPRECSLALGLVAAEARLAAREALARTTQSDTANPKLSARKPRSSSEQMIRDMFCKKTEAWQTNGIWIMAGSSVTHYWRCSFHKRSTRLMLKTEAERDPQKTEVIYCITDLDAAHPEWRISDVRPLASVSTASHGNVTLGVAVGQHQCVADHLLARSKRHPSNA